MAKTIIDGFTQLHEKGLIGEQNLVDLLCRFAGELVDVDEVLGRGKPLDLGSAGRDEARRFVPYQFEWHALLLQG